jgi:tRNA A-37 threonylcarbamoyl transferase component Bud32
VSPVGKGEGVVLFHKALSALVKFHLETKWVHGDARAANFILVGDSVVVIDLAHSFSSQDPTDRQLDVAMCILSYLRLEFDPSSEKNWSTVLNAQNTLLVKAVHKLYPRSGSPDTGATDDITQLVDNLLEGRV